MLHDRLLRPAMVGIAKSGDKDEQKLKEEENPKDDQEQN